MNNNNFSIILQRWYDINKRDLPWRNTNDPYKIWLSEIILQQTRVVQGLPYFDAFLEHFPVIEDLAAASEQEILRIWQGLGYYSRARNLHACAREIVHDRKGIFPDNYKDLLVLKGIGTYTAAAIASFAFKEAVAVIDGNVTRVLSRIFGIEKDITAPEGKKYFVHLANEMLDKVNPDNHNQAIMEFGALQCTPVPKCLDCPFQVQCFAYKHNLQKELPVKSRKIKVKERHFFYLVMEFEGKIFMQRRVKKDIWQGLNDFYLIEESNFKKLALSENEFVKKLLSFNSKLEQVPDTYQHKLTHQKIIAHFYNVKIYDAILANEILNFANFALYTLNEILTIPKPILIHNYLFKKLNMLN